MNTPFDISGALLAGGKSRRMGTEKALVKIGNTTLIERAIRLMNAVTARPMIITNTPEKFGHLHLPLHRDIIPGLGPLGGIYTALEYASKNHVLILACDMPSITPRIVRELGLQSDRHDISVLDAGSGLEPLCAVYSKRCLPVIKQQIEKGDLKVTNVFSQMKKVKVLNLTEVDESVSRDHFLNVNTPSDRLLAEKIFGGEDR